jgi:hypothetical protein
MIKTRPEQVLRCPALLCPFHLLCYANLKKYVFDHHFSFPSLPSKWTVTNTQAAQLSLIKVVDEYVLGADPEQRGFFVLSQSKDTWTVHPLSFLLTNNKVHSCLNVYLYIGHDRLLKLIYNTRRTNPPKSPFFPLPTSIIPPDSAYRPLLSSFRPLLIHHARTGTSCVHWAPHNSKIARSLGKRF